MVRIATGEDPVAARIAIAVVVVAGHLDCGLIALGATTGEVHLIDVVRGDAHQAIGERDCLIVAELPERGEVFEGLDLLGSNLGDLLAAMADLSQPQTTGGIEILAALGVSEAATATAGHDDPLGER